jgi:hypothetical protein
MKKPARAPLRIAFDLDGVLADMDTELIRQSAILFGEPVTSRRPNQPRELGEPGEPSEPTGLILSSRQQQRLWRHVESLDNFWETLAECEPGVVARLAAIAADRRWEVIFLTRRPASGGATVQVQTQRWLAAKGFALPSVFVVQRSRGRIAASLELDVVVDDRPENCLDVVVDSKARAILVWRGEPQLVPPATERLGIGVVSTVGRCLDILVELDTTPAPRRRVVDSLKRLLGLPGSTPGAGDSRRFSSQLDARLDFTQQSDQND